MVTVRADPEFELLFEVFRLTYPILHSTREKCGHVPVPGSPAWWRSADDVKVAGLLTLSGDHLIYDPDQLAAEKIKQMAIDLSRGHDWTAASRRPSHATLIARRAESGPMRAFDAAAARRWVDTGTSEGGAA